MSQEWHRVDSAQSDNSDTSQAPDKPGLDEEQKQDNVQTQTQSQQQPPVKQEQSSSDQPQVRGGRYKAEPKEDIPIPEAAQLGSLHDAHYVPMPTGGLRALAIQLWPDDRDNPDLFNQHVADLLMMNRDVVLNEFAHPVGAFVRIR